MSPEAYRLFLTEADVDAIAFVGNRYAWSASLLGLEPGEHEIAEHEAWCLKDAFESDTEGGHSPFPMLDPRSELAAKLAALWNSVV